jgi:hypothetical protein
VTTASSPRRKGSVEAKRFELRMKLHVWDQSISLLCLVQENSYLLCCDCEVNKNKDRPSCCFTVLLTLLITLVSFLIKICFFLNTFHQFPNPSFSTFVIYGVFAISWVALLPLHLLRLSYTLKLITATLSCSIFLLLQSIVSNMF